MVSVDNIKLTPKEFSITNQFSEAKIIKDFVVKTAGKNQAHSTAARVYIPKEWEGDTILLIRLKRRKQ